MPVTSQNSITFNNYDGFVEKFKPKKTTDDCYTPDNVYNAVANWVANEYHVDSETFARPFYPGGDFENYDYRGKVVVDNPPFSILSKIVDFYVNNNIKFFLFAPTLCGLTRYSDMCTALAVGISIVYQNGARVNTSFVTNLESNEVRMRTAPGLYSAVKSANNENVKKQKKQLPRYSYPDELVTAASLYPFSKVGIDLQIPRDECARVSKLDNQPKGKGVFGTGLLLSKRLTEEVRKAEREKAEREKAEREKAEREKAFKFQLSPREREIVENLTREQR